MNALNYPYDHDILSAIITRYNILNPSDPYAFWLQLMRSFNINDGRSVSHLLRNHNDVRHLFLNILDIVNDHNNQVANFPGLLAYITVDNIADRVRDYLNGLPDPIDPDPDGLR